MLNVAALPRPTQGMHNAGTDTQDYPVSVVRHPSRRGGNILHNDLQELPHQPDHRYGKAGHDTHGMDAGSVMTVAFEVEGQSFVALNGGPHFKFNEAVSFQITCETQDEIDYFWSKLSEDGQESQCGWLKDKFGLSWQVVPAILLHLLMGDDKAKSERAMAALMQMKKLDIAALQRAHAGGGQT
jgi:predicted 3-demethylubiquinone-9 3-methyltransferase (glyoxalase superfamily)